MMYSNNKASCIAPKTASALALAKSRAGAVFSFLICASAFHFVFLGACNAFCSESVVQGQTPWIIDYQPGGHSMLGNVLSDINDDLDWLEVFYNDFHNGDSQLYYDRGLLGNIYDLQRAVIGSRISDYTSRGILDYLNEITENDSQIFLLFSQVSNITNMYDSMRVFFASNQYAIASGVDSVNSALRTDAGQGEETVAEIVADIRDRMTNQTDFALGNAFTNFVAALAYQYRANADTNYNNIADSLLSEDGEFYSKYGLQPLYYNMIFGGLPFDKSYNALAGPNPFGVPNSIWNRMFTSRVQFFNTLRNRPAFNIISNQLTSVADMRYHLYNTYQSRAMLSNLFYNANMVTWTNMQQAGISPDNFAMHWFDSYNTKFQNMLLQYANAESMTNENITVPEYARRWFDTYNTLKSGLAGEYLINHDIIEGTNSFQDVAYEVTSRESTWKQYLPTWGIEDENGELELGEIQQRQDSGYKSEMDDIKRESVGNSEYIQTGLDLISDLKDEYSDFTLRLEGLVGDNDDSLQLRITPFQSELVPLQEDYINFKMSQAVKDKLTWFWWVLDGIIRMGILSWSFFHLWGVLMGRDFIGGSK